MENLDLEKIYKMVAIEKPKEVNVLKDIKLFEEIFPNDNKNSQTSSNSELCIETNVIIIFYILTYIFLINLFSSLTEKPRN